MLSWSGGFAERVNEPDDGSLILLGKRCDLLELLPESFELGVCRLGGLLGFGGLGFGTQG